MFLPQEVVSDDVESTPREHQDGMSRKASPGRHLDYSALLNALVTADQALIGRLLTGPLSSAQQAPQHWRQPGTSECYEDHDQRSAGHDWTRHGPHVTDQSCETGVDSPEHLSSYEKTTSRTIRVEAEINQSCPPQQDLSLIGPEHQQAILQSIERVSLL